MVLTLTEYDEETAAQLPHHVFVLTLLSYRSLVLIILLYSHKGH